MEITTEQIKALRDETGVSIMQCKKALEEADGDREKALVLLKKKSSETAEKKADRELGAGVVGSYVHNTKEVAGMVLLACETDFVAKNEEFIALANDVAMHVTATSPAYLTRDQLPAESVDKAKSVFAEEVADKPADKQAQIMEGKLDAYFRDQILLEQTFIKDGEKTIDELLKEAVQKFGENVMITDMSRLSLR